MRLKHIFAILLLASLGLVAVLFLHAAPGTSVAAAPPPAPPREEILVAARPLASGLLLRAQGVTWHARVGAAQTGDIVRPSAEEHAAKPKNDDAPLTRRSVSETVVDNLRVLAIDTSTKPGAGASAITVTLESLPQQAEKINVAQELGKLSLTLRSLDEPGIAAAPARAQPPTWAGDVSPALTSAAPPAKVIAAEKPAIKVMRGTNSIDTKAQ